MTSPPRYCMPPLEHEADTIYARPPEAYFPLKNVLWRHLRAVYGLRATPRALQYFFRGQTSETGSRSDDTKTVRHGFIQQQSNMTIYPDGGTRKSENPPKDKLTPLVPVQAAEQAK